MFPSLDFTMQQHLLNCAIRRADSQAKSGLALYGRQLFAYLPTSDWMQRAGYEEKLIGDYCHQQAGQPAYRLVALSQSGLFLFYREEQLLKSAVVTSDEDLLRFLALLGFPLPA